MTKKKTVKQFSIERYRKRWINIKKFGQFYARIEGKICNGKKNGSLIHIKI